MIHSFPKLREEQYIQIPILINCCHHDQILTVNLAIRAFGLGLRMKKYKK